MTMKSISAFLVLVLSLSHVALAQPCSEHSLPENDACQERVSSQVDPSYWQAFSNQFGFYLHQVTLRAKAYLHKTEPKCETWDSGRVRIVSPYLHEAGLKQDIKVVTDLFSPHLTVDTFVSENGDSSKMPNVLANIFLTNPDLSLISKAKYNIVIINHEFTQAPEYFAEIDLVFCKSRHAVELMREFRERYGLSFEILYTGFTSIVPSANSSVPKNPNLVGHFAGQSWFKNTGAVLDAWLSDSSLPKLVATCRLLQVQVGYWIVDVGCKPEFLATRNVTGRDNLEVFDELLTADHIADLQVAAGIHLVPSAVEGFGHAINQGRALGAIVITTDAPPMNELIQDGKTGILIQPRMMLPFNHYSGAREAVIEPKDVIHAVRRAMGMSEAERREMGMRAQAAFEKERSFLASHLTAVALSLALKGDLSLINF